MERIEITLNKENKAYITLFGKTYEIVVKKEIKNDKNNTNSTNNTKNV